MGLSIPTICCLIIVLLFGMLSFISIIIRRSHSENLDIQEFSLNSNLSKSYLKVCLAGSAVINCEIYETDLSVECLVLTSNGAARFSFEHPSRLTSGVKIIFLLNLFLVLSVCSRLSR